MRTGGGTVLDAEDITILERLTSLVIGDIVNVVGVTVRGGSEWPDRNHAKF